MMVKKELCVSYFILTCSIALCSGFAYWLSMDSDIEKARDYSEEYHKLLLHQQYDEAKEFRSETLISIFNEKIDNLWWHVIYGTDDGYAKLQLYARFLAGNPRHEEVYKEIARLLEIAQEEFSVEEKTKYLMRLNAIPDVHAILLERYNLLDTNASE